MKNLSPINENKDVVTKEYVDPVKSQAAINRTTLGTQCKNLLKNTAVTTTKSGITFTVNDDSTITANGTATSRIIFLVGAAYISQTGNYTYTGTPSGGASATYSMNYRNSNNVYKTAETGNGITAQFEGGKTYEAVIDIRSGVTISNLTFSPMLRYADILDDTYEPYKPSLQERIIGAYFPITQEKGLANNTDLNTITEIGNYVCYTGSSAATMINCPTKAGGFRLIVTNLIVSSNDNSTIRYQWIIPNNLNDVLCFRRRIDMSTDTFSNWYSFKSYQPGLQEQIPYSISVSGKSTSAAISYNGVPTLICLTPNTADSTAGGLYMINSAGAVVKLIEKTGVVVAADTSSNTFTITNNTSTVMDVCISRCWGR